MLSFICHCGVMCLKQQVWATSFGQDLNKSPIRGSCKQAVYLETARIRAHVQGSYKGSWPLTSQVDYKVRRPLIFLREIRAQNMSGCENCHQLGRWHVEGREKMRDCIYPLLTRRLSGHQKNLSNLVYHGTTSCMTASLEVDCEQSSLSEFELLRFYCSFVFIETFIGSVLTRINSWVNHSVEASVFTLPT